MCLHGGSASRGVVMPQTLDYLPQSNATPKWHDAMRQSGPLLAFFTIVSTWLSAGFGAILFPVPIVLFALLIATRRWGLVALCALLSPMTLSFAAGVAGYCTGTATINGMGLPGTGYHNLDPELRCGRSTGGCLVNGGEILTDPPHNLAVVALTRLFGPQPGAYTGPYPTESEAKAALASAPPVSIDLLLKDQVDVAQPPVKLDAGVGAGLLKPSQIGMLHEQLPSPYAREFLDELGADRGALFQNTCLLLRLPGPDAASAMIVLLDTATGRPFAYYGEGEFYQRFPPVAWRK